MPGQARAHQVLRELEPPLGRDLEDHHREVGVGVRREDVGRGVVGGDHHRGLAARQVDEVGAAHVLGGVHGVALHLRASACRRSASCSSAPRPSSPEKCSCGWPLPSRSRPRECSVNSRGGSTSSLALDCQASLPLAKTTTRSSAARRVLRALHARDDGLELLELLARRGLQPLRFEPGLAVLRAGGAAGAARAARARWRRRRGRSGCGAWCSPGTDGGGCEIRTHEQVTLLPVFKTGALNRSANPP